MCIADTRLTSGFPPKIQQEGGHRSFWGHGPRKLPEQMQSLYPPTEDFHAVLTC